MKYLTFKQLREKLGWRSRTSIYNDVEQERLPKPIKLGGRLFWDESAVDESLNPSASKEVAQP